MKTKIYTSSNKKFENVSDFALKAKINEAWNEQRKISGLTLYIGLNWNKDEHLKELLTRKGYQQSDFITFGKDAKGKNTAKVERVNFDFVLSHMKHSAKVLHSVVDVVSPLPEGAKVSKDGLKMIIAQTQKVDTVIQENGKDVTVTTVKEIAKVYYTINTVIDELRKCEVTSSETRTILK